MSAIPFSAQPAVSRRLVERRWREVFEFWNRIAHDRISTLCDLVNSKRLSAVRNLLFLTEAQQTPHRLKPVRMTKVPR